MVEEEVEGEETEGEEGETSVLLTPSPFEESEGERGSFETDFVGGSTSSPFEGCFKIERMEDCLFFFLRGGDVAWGSFSILREPKRPEDEEEREWGGCVGDLGEEGCVSGECIGKD